MRIRGLLVGLVSLVWLFTGTKVHSQIDTSQIMVISASDTSGMQGSIVCVDFPVQNFDNIQSLQFSIHFDPTVMTPQCPPPGNIINIPGLGPSNFNCLEINEGHIKMIWLDPDNGTTCGVSLPDGVNIFSLCFELTGQPGTVSPIYIAGTQLPIEYTQIPDCSDPDTFIERNNTTIAIGRVTILCGSLSVYDGKCDSAPGQNNGSLNFYPCGGRAPFSYSINGGAYTGTITGERETTIVSDLPPGTYTVTITDANGDTASGNMISIGESQSIIVNALITQPTCYDRSNGVIEILNISGGTAPYTTIWDNFNFDNPEYRRLSNGNYGLTITDASGCKLEETFAVTRDTIKANAQIISDATCPGSTDGIIQLTATGGNPYSGNEYSFNFRPPTDTFIVADAPEGWFYYTVTDSSIPSCRSDVDSILVRTQTNITTLPEIDNISCYGNVDGRIFLTGMGSSLFNFTLLDKNGLNLGGSCRSNNTTMECFNLPKDTFYMVTTDRIIGCVKIDTIEIEEPDSLQIGFTSFDPTCRGSDGSIEINALGGTTGSDYTVTWSDGGSGLSRVNLAGGTYDITVADDNGCSKLLNIQLSPPVLIQIDATVAQPVQCNDGNDGELSVEVVTSGNYVFRWTLGGDTISTDQRPTGLSPGGYEIIVRDTILDCQARDSVYLNNPAGIELSANYSLPLCPFPEYTTGSIGVVAAGGSGNYTYLWDNNSTNSVRASIASGTYGVTVTDNMGCSVDTFLFLDNPDTITVTLDNIAGVTCFGESNGQATAFASGGTINDGSYNFFWSSGAMDVDIGFSMSRASNLNAGLGYVIVTDAQCPADTVFFDITDIDSIALDNNLTTVQDPNCFGDCNGTITAVAQGGNATSYSYQWMFDGSVSPTLENICSGNYTVLITDANNCTVMDSVTLVDPDSLAVDVDNTATVDPNCFNAGEAQIAVIASGGIPAYTYTWTGGVSDSPIASSLDDGNYFITVTDESGCTAITSYILVSPSPIQAVIPQPEPPNCFGGKACVNVTSVSGGSGDNYTFTVNRGIRFPVDSCIEVFAGPYTVTVFDGDGCNEEYQIEVGQPAPLNVDLGPDQTISLGESTEPINVDIDAVFEITEIAWNPIDSLECLTSDCQVVRMSPETSTTFTVFITDENGCMASDEITIDVSKRRNVYAPNIFSPNRDGNNDYFQLTIGPGVTVVADFLVFDRWGQPVWKQENYLPDGSETDGWDGTIGNQDAIPGVYGYIAKVRFIDDQEVVFKGSITLIR
jgi:gliding motility-associated-like protein